MSKDFFSTYESTGSIDGKKLYVFYRMNKGYEQKSIFLAESKEEVIKHLNYFGLYPSISDIEEKDITIIKSKSDILNDTIESVGI